MSRSFINYFIMPMALFICIAQPFSSFFAIMSLAMSISFMTAAFLVASVIFIMESFADFMFASEQFMPVVAAGPCARAGAAASNAAARAAQASGWVIFIGGCS